MKIFSHTHYTGIAYTIYGSTYDSNQVMFWVFFHDVFIDVNFPHFEINMSSRL